jgi:hypothetical protein
MKSLPDWRIRPERRPALVTTRLSCFLVPLLLLGAHGVQAEEQAAGEPEAKRGYVLVGNQLPASREQTSLEVEATPNRADWLDAVHIDRKAGFALRRSFRLGERKLVFGVKGPIQKKKRLGVSVEFRF